MKILSILVIVFLSAGAFFTSSCSHYPVNPGDTTKHPCDTCCDTCHSIDTTKHPCDTCNIDKDSAAHAFIWTEYTIPGETSLTGVWVFGPNDIHIVGNYLWKYNGSEFLKIHTSNTTTHTTLDGALNGFSMFGFDKDDYWLVSGSIALYCNFDGDFVDNRPGRVNACWGPSSNDMFFVGNGGQIHHYDGTKFTDMTSPTTKDLRSVWGTSHNDVWASGYSSSKGETVLIHFNGTSWEEDNVSITHNAITGGFNAVWACDSAGHKFVTTSGGLLIRKTDNGNWRSDSGLVPNRLNDGSFVGIAPYGNSANDMMAIGGWGFVAHWNGKTWKKYDELYNYGNPNYGPGGFSMKGNIACVVGTKSGSSWVAIGRRK